MKKSQFYSLASIAAISAAIPSFMSHIVIPVTASITPHVLYQTDGEVMRGDYASFPFQHSFINNNEPTKLTKKVGCIEGDELLAQNGAVYCNSKIIGIIEPAILKNPKVTKFNFVGVIPRGQVFMVGEHPASFDSRYFGFVKTASLKKAIPLI